ncbi:unnamed protein product [Trichogramma brassicae]|uniref:Complex 1 LYR protein domain-containing protein n=1 Tax=Trichogramma brassicae TaxID=86971 RepID=A0A6H5HW45_9HYME|nr:unnamed protein product [Trichogramma brassicae]
MEAKTQNGRFVFVSRFRTFILVALALELAAVLLDVLERDLPRASVPQPTAVALHLLPLLRPTIDRLRLYLIYRSNSPQDTHLDDEALPAPPPDNVNDPRYINKFSRVIMPFRYELLGLYKNLMRYSQNLKYTDKKYFVHRVRKAFLNNRTLTEETEVDFHYQKGLMLLKHKRVI